MRGDVTPFQPLLEQRQVLFQPPDLLSLDAGDVSVPVHVPEREQDTQGKPSVPARQEGLFSGTFSLHLSALPIHVQHGGKLKLVVDLLGPSERLVEFKSGQFKGQHRREFSEPVLKDNRDVDIREINLPHMYIT